MSRAVPSSWRRQNTKLTKAAMDTESATDARHSTLPVPLHYDFAGFESEDAAHQFQAVLSAYLHAIGREIDLSQLDGISVAYDYRQALLAVELGYPSNSPITPSDTYGTGIAMTVTVLRSGYVKSHIVFNANIVRAIEDQGHADWELSVHTIAHECAHVEVTCRFDAAFPGRLPRPRFANGIDAYHEQIIRACWDEYAVTRISAPYGADRTADYETNFLDALGGTTCRVHQTIAAYRPHDSVDRVLGEVYGAFGVLLKFSCYHLGNLKGQGMAPCDLPRTIEALDGHWFAPYFAELQTVCEAIDAQYGHWKDLAVFDGIGALADQLVALSGVRITMMPDGRPFVEIPIMEECRPTTYKA